MRRTLRNVYRRTIVRFANSIVDHTYDKRRRYKTHIHSLLWERATADSAEFIEHNIETAIVFRNPQEIWDYAISKIPITSGVLILEFGVYKGASINYFASQRPNAEFIGFDSFEGLKEDWKGHHRSKSSYSLDGELPKVRENVRLVKGWFDETLPEVLSELAHIPELIHIDSDTYEAAKFVLNECRPGLKKPTIVLFDEFHSYPNWRNGEMKALIEYADLYGLEIEYLAFADQQALVKISKNA